MAAAPSKVDGLQLLAMAAAPSKGKNDRNLNTQFKSIVVLAYKNRCAHTHTHTSPSTNTHLVLSRGTIRHQGSSCA